MPHAFVRHPHRTLLGLALPVLGSMLSEPLAGLVDTAFVARLGVTELAAVGIATTLLSSTIWVFNFLGVGTQTEVAHALGRGDLVRARQMAALTLWLAAGVGTLLAVLGWGVLEPVCAWMSADPAAQAESVAYLRVRLLGAPAALVLLAAFGSLRGRQDMRSPLWIAGTMSLANITLDPLLIFGAGPVPALGVVGAAWATSISQIGAALWAVARVGRRVGFERGARPAQAGRLFVVGRDMLIRTAALLCFMLFATRAALAAGVEAGAAHQAIRQVWALTAFLLDAIAVTAQSLVGFFLGARLPGVARRVAQVSCGWGLALGTLLALAMWALEPAVAALLVPGAARGVFGLAWGICALSQPLNALSFVTDGIHWGASDFAWLRNGMLLATAVGLIGLWLLDLQSSQALAAVWGVTAIWISLRGTLGVLRVWPGLGSAPLRTAARAPA